MKDSEIIELYFARSEDAITETDKKHGAFCRAMTEAKEIPALMDEILRRDRAHTLPDQWMVQILSRILLRARVIYISEADDALVRGMHMIPAHSTEEALKIADSLLGKENAPVTVIPDGVSVVVR